ncbi:MAG: phospholipid carrier-dependent glycosyltransferase [Candidatus Berkelbacteria bacterium]
MLHIFLAVISTKAWLFDKTGITSAIVLIFFALTLYLLTLFFQSKKDQPDDFRASFIAALATTSVVAIIFAELLSLFNSLSRIPITALWLIFILWLISLNKKEILAGRTSIFSQRKIKTGKKVIGQRFFFAILLIFLTATFTVAYFSSPNNWDSMTYHLPRILHWIQNQNLNFYPTNNTRQLYSSPGAEIFSLNFFLLTAGDRLANIIQWLAYLGSIISASLICRSLGGNKYSQAAAAILLAALPAAILQSTSTQNDLTATFFILCAVYFILELIKKLTRLNIILVGCTIGLAVLVKASSAFFLAPFVIFYGINLIQINKKASIRPMIMIFLIAMAINTPFLVRNYQFYHSLTAPESKTLTNANFGWKETSSNLVKNIAINSVIGNNWIVSKVDLTVKKFHQKINYPLNSMKTSFGDGKFILAPLVAQTNEDLAGNPILLIAILLSIIIAIFSWRKTPKAITIFLILSLLALVIFSTVFRWQVWGTRLMLPFFALATIPVSLILFNRKYFTTFWLIFLSLGLLIVSNQFLMTNMTRPLIGPTGIMVTKRYNQYFVYKPNLMYSLPAAVEQIGECKKVGLRLGGDDFEYPLWLTLKNRNNGITIDDVLVANGTETTASKNYGSKCAIISTTNFIPELVFNNQKFDQAWTASDNSVILYLPINN